VPNAENMNLVADSFISDDVWINEGPLAEVVADRPAPLRKVLQTVAGFNKAGGHAASGLGIELVDIAANTEQIIDR
jgi:hypothetical protein